MHSLKSELTEIYPW